MSTKKANKITHEYPILLSVQMGATINMGNYESKKISLGITYPVYEENAVVGIKKQLEKFIEKEINKKVKELKKEADKGFDLVEIEEIEESQ